MGCLDRARRQGVELDAGRCDPVTNKAIKRLVDNQITRRLVISRKSDEAYLTLRRASQDAHYEEETCRSESTRPCWMR